LLASQLPDGVRHLATFRGGLQTSAATCGLLPVNQRPQLRDLRVRSPFALVGLLGPLVVLVRLVELNLLTGLLVVLVVLLTGLLVVLLDLLTRLLVLVLTGLLTGLLVVLAGLGELPRLELLTLLRPSLLRRSVLHLLLARLLLGRLLLGRLLLGCLLLVPGPVVLLGLVDDGGH
jgi:hypothetical protein